MQFSDDPALAGAVAEAGEVVLEGVTLRVIRVLHEELRAGSDPARRRSKRIQDLPDVRSLIEQVPELIHELTAAERAMLDEFPG